MDNNQKTGLTICIMVYNEEDYLEETLNIVVRNYELTDYVYISDNCSTDASAKIIEYYAKKYSRIISFRHAQKQPAAKHMLWVLQQVQTEYVLFLRPKNFLSENFIKLCFNKLKDCPDAVATYADIYYVNKEQRLNLVKGIEMPQGSFDEASFILESNAVRDRVEFVSRRDVTHIVYQVCRTEALLESVMRTEYEESGGDNIIALRMSILGKWMLVREAKYYYYVRKETRMEIAERLESAGFSVDEENPYWYVPLEFLKICRLKIPRIFDERLKEEIIFNFRLRGMELDDIDWRKRHTKGWMISNVRKKANGKNIVLFGTGECAREIYKRIQDKINISFFIDNDDRKWGKEFFSKKICAPQSVQEGNFVICIASNKYMHDMIEQMKKYGYVYFENLFCLTGELPYECL